MQRAFIVAIYFISLLKNSMQNEDQNVSYIIDNYDNYFRMDDNEPLDMSDVYSNLTEYFPCLVTMDDDLYVSCNNVHIGNVSEYLPVDTKHLSISNSYFPILRKDYFRHLHKLESLTLANNSHRYITSKAFQGLDNLKQLNLSQNNIMVLKTAFNPTPKLERIDFSSNNIGNLRTIANAVSHLKNLTVMNLNHNTRIRNILYDDFLPLENSTLETLRLANTTINYIEKYSFRYLHRLKTLDLSVNYLNEEGLLNATSGLSDTTIEVLRLHLLAGLQDFSLKALIPLVNTTITKLDFGYNPIRTVPSFPYMPSLKSLELPSCNILNFENGVFNNFPNLERLVLDDNEISFIDDSVIPVKTLQVLSLRNQVIPVAFMEIFSIKDYTFSKATKLQTLSFDSTNLMSTIHRYSFFGLRNLKILHLSKTKIMIIEDYAFETLDSLRELHLHANGLKYLSNFTLYGLKNLKILNLALNSIILSEGTLPFQNMPLLKALLLQRNKIEQIPENALSWMHELQYLSLSKNSLTPWTQPIVSKQANLTMLHLFKNQLTHITPAMMTDFQKVIRNLDVTDNPFNCSSCEMEIFQNFINASSLTFRYPIPSVYEGSYTCVNPPELRGLPLLQTNLSAYYCFEMVQLEDDISSLILSCAILLLVFVSIWISYYFRYYFKYLLFHCNAAVKERRTSANDDLHYIYDAFVSYNTSDTLWVASYLVPELEQKEPHLRLCVHERDFKAGCLITDNILDAIENSRKVILVLSEDFVKSDWCMFELHMAQHKLFDEKRDVLILAKLTNINKKLYTKNLSYLEKTRPCCLWTNDPMGQKLFWDKLKKNLSSSRQSVISSSTKV